MPNETETGSFSPMFRSTWLTVFIVEYAVTSIINGFTILTHARNRHLRKRTTYLIINLTIAVFLVGTVSGPMHIYHTMTFERGSGFGWGKIMVIFLDNLFTCSLLHLALLSVERLHATLFPIRHCLLLDWVYFKAVVCIWLLAIIPTSTAATCFLITLQGSKYAWASLVIAVLFTAIVSYVMIIALNVKRKIRPYSFGAVSSDRKLTVTLSVVIALSSLAFLPYFFYSVLKKRTRLRGLSVEAQFGIQESFNVFFYANSFVNPLVYTLRMKEFRKATRVWCGSVNTVSWS